MATSRKPHDTPGVIAAVAFICLGLYLVLQTGTMTAMGSVFPITISVAMVVLSVILIARNVIIGMRRGEDQPREAAEEEPARESMWRRVAFLVVMAVWIVLMPVLGFFVASLLAFFTIMGISIHERLGKREAVLMTVIGIAMVAAFYLLMANVLLIPLPRGLFF